MSRSVLLHAHRATRAIRLLLINALKVSRNYSAVNSKRQSNQMGLIVKYSVEKLLEFFSCANSMDDPSHTGIIKPRLTFGAQVAQDC